MSAVAIKNNKTATPKASVFSSSASTCSTTGHPQLFSQPWSPPSDSSRISEYSSDSSHHVEVMQMLLAHKQVVLEANPEPTKIDGFAPITLLDKKSCAKRIGYKEKRIPYHMREGSDISRDPSARSFVSGGASCRSTLSADDRKVPREMSRRHQQNEKKNKNKKEKSKSSFLSPRSPADQASLGMNADWRSTSNSSSQSESSPVEASPRLLNETATPIGIRVGRRATVVDELPGVHAHVHLQTRGRSNTRRGTIDREEVSKSPSSQKSGAFSSRKERAEYFKSLKQEQEASGRAASPWGDDKSGSSGDRSSGRKKKKSKTQKKKEKAEFGAALRNRNAFCLTPRLSQASSTVSLTKIETEEPAPQRKFATQLSHSSSHSSLAPLVDMNKVDVKRFSRENSMEPSTTRSMAPTVIVSSRETSVEPIPTKRNPKKPNVANLCAALEKLGMAQTPRNMALGPDGDKKGFSRPRSPVANRR